MDLPDKINHFYYHMALYELQLMSGGDFYNGLSYNSLLYLNVIGQMKDCTVSRLADALCITRAAVTLKVNELVKQGLSLENRTRPTGACISCGSAPRSDISQIITMKFSLE